MHLTRAAVPVVALAVLLVGGCRAGAATTDDDGARSTSIPASADPLPGIDATLDAVERDLDADADG